MVASTEFLPFGTAAGANVASQASWFAGAWRTGGFLTGIAQSQQVNKALRQSLFVSSALMTFVANTLSIATNDDGDLNGAVTSLGLALAAYARSSVYGAFGVAAGSANTITVTTTPTRPAYQDGEALFVRITTTNTGVVAINRDGLGLVNVLRPDNTALKAGDLVAASVALMVLNLALGAYILVAIPNVRADGGVRSAVALTAASGNWIVPPGITRIWAEAIGAGGAGGGSTGTAGAGGGGGGGGFGGGWLDVVPGQSIPYVNGAKGTGSTGTGGNGGTTSFNSGAVSAQGGQGGQGGGSGGAGNGGSPGAGLTGDIVLNGAQGDAGATTSGVPVAGRGGDAARGGGGGGAPAGPAPGSGGGGGGAVNAAGGNGNDGITFVFW